MRQIDFDEALTKLAESIGEEACDTAFAEGRWMSFDRRVALALGNDMTPHRELATGKATHRCAREHRLFTSRSSR